VTAKFTIQYKQLTAVFFLLLSFAVSVIQVSHSHPAATAVNQKIIAAQRSNLPGYLPAVPHSKCLICEYQLAKDADVPYDSFQPGSSLQFGDVTAVECSYHFPKANTVFENRGPPSA
jgi:hypothetical protein